VNRGAQKRMKRAFIREFGRAPRTAPEYRSRDWNRGVTSEWRSLKNAYKRSRIAQYGQGVD
jgi:hypothetical protein